MTHSNREQIINEAKRRSMSLGKTYAVYQHKRNTGDHVMRPADWSPPNPYFWQRVLTISNGELQ